MSINHHHYLCSSSNSECIADLETSFGIGLEKTLSLGVLLLLGFAVALCVFTFEQFSKLLKKEEQEKPSNVLQVKQDLSRKDSERGEEEEEKDLERKIEERMAEVKRLYKDVFGKELDMEELKKEM